MNFIPDGMLAFFILLTISECIEIVGRAINIVSN